MPEIHDHDGKPVHHHMARVNGIRLHYIKSGSGPPLLLLHGTPKTHYYWYRIVPLLTKKFTIIAPDLRGFGATDKPPASEGYDGRTNAKDMAELMTQLGYEKFSVHGEDRGATYAFCLAPVPRARYPPLLLRDAAFLRPYQTNVLHAQKHRSAVQSGWCVELAYPFLLAAACA